MNRILRNLILFLTISTGFIVPAGPVALSADESKQPETVDQKASATAPKAAASSADSAAVPDDATSAAVPPQAKTQRQPGSEEAGAPATVSDSTGVESATVSAETASADQPASPAEIAPTGEGQISVDFKDAEIRQVLRIISLKSGVDIVAGADVEGLVTIKLTNVPWEQALDIILRTYGFTYERKGAIIRVMTVSALEKEALSTEVFPLDYAKAKEVPDVVKEMLSERGRVKFDERTNTIIVTDIPTNLYQIKQVIARLDQRTPQVLIETKIVETRLEKDEQLGIDWSDSITFTASSVSIPSTFPFPGGGDLLGSVGRAFIPRAGTFSPTTGASITRGRIPENGGTFTFGTLTSTGLNTVIHFLQSRTDTKVVSNPSISALNNQKAAVHIGSEYPIPNYSIDPSTGRTTITGYTAKQIGTVLTVTPHVNPSDEIVVELKPEIITVLDPVTYDTGNNAAISLPQFSTQTAETQVRIKNNETIAIGGLIKEANSKVVSKVPLLGDIPFFGSFFKSTAKYGGSDPVRQDLLIFLTVKLTDSGRTNPAVALTAQSSPPAVAAQ